jgi:exopolysaccharide production protein ExoQ
MIATHPISIHETTAWSPGRLAFVWLTIGVLAAAFYLIEHRNTRVSQLDAFHISGEEMALRAAQGDAARRAAIPTIGLFGAWLLMRRGGCQPKLGTRLGWLLIGYLAWCALSIFWSPHLLLTVRHVGVLVICGVGALGVARQITLRELCMVALGVTTLLVLNSVRSEIALGTFRPFAAEYRFAGNLHPNVQAPYCAMMALSAACLASQAKRGRGFLWALCLVGLGLMVLTKSRTVCGVFLAGTVVYSLIGAPWPKKLMAGTTILGIGCAAAFVALLLGWDLERHLVNMVLIGRQEDSEALSGRLPLWAALIPHWLEHPFLGHGYQTFWNPERIGGLSNSVQWTVSNGHSALLDTLLDLGLIGAALFVVAVIVGLRDVARRWFASRDIGYGFLFALLAGRTVIALLESAFLTPTNFVSFILVCGLAHAAFCQMPREAVQAAN